MCSGCQKLIERRYDDNTVAPIIPREQQTASKALQLEGPAHAEKVVSMVTYLEDRFKRRLRYVCLSIDNTPHPRHFKNLIDKMLKM
jgi:hypothetical protein